MFIHCSHFVIMIHDVKEVIKMDMGNKTPKNWDTQKIAKVFCLGIFCFVCGFFGGVVGDYSQLGEKSNSNSTASIVEPSIDDNQEGSNNTVPDTNDGNSNSENNNTFGNNDNDSSSSDEDADEDEDKAALGITVRTISNTETGQMQLEAGVRRGIPKKSE